MAAGSAGRRLPRRANPPRSRRPRALMNMQLDANEGAPSELARLGPARLGSARRGSQDAAAASRDPLGAVRPLLPRVFTDFRPPQDPLRDCGVTSGWPRGSGSALVPAALPRRSGSSPRRAGGCHPPAGAVTPLPVLSPPCRCCPRVPSTAGPCPREAAGSWLSAGPGRRSGMKDDFLNCISVRGLSGLMS